MLDIYLIGMAVAAAIKVQDYADIQPGSALIAYLSLTVLSILTLIHVNLERLWSATITGTARKAHRRRCVCLSCHYTTAIPTRAAAARVAMPMCHRQPYSLQKPGRR